jgi:hypothetical protein
VDIRPETAQRDKSLPARPRGKPVARQFLHTCRCRRLSSR